MHSDIEKLFNQYPWLSILVIIGVSSLITIIYYNHKDKYESEPFFRLIYAILLGVVSVIPALFLSLLVVNYVTKDIYQTVIVAPIVEEIVKLLFVIYLSRSDSFDGPLDGFVYGAMVGTGFAATENVLYGLSFYFQYDLLAGIVLTSFRSLFMIVGHPLFTGIAGYGVGAKKVGMAWTNYGRLWKAILLHGLWNSTSLLKDENSLIALGGLVIILIWFMKREISEAVELDRKAYERGYYKNKNIQYSN